MALGAAVRPGKLAVDKDGAAGMPPGVCGSGGMMRSASASTARPSSEVK
jgi:hypothetical protein